MVQDATKRCWRSAPSQAEGPLPIDSALLAGSIVETGGLPLAFTDVGDCDLAAALAQANASAQIGCVENGLAVDLKDGIPRFKACALGGRAAFDGAYQRPSSRQAGSVWRRHQA